MGVPELNGRRWWTLDRAAFRYLWAFMTSEWPLRVALILWLLAMLFFIRFASAQDFQRQIDRIERQVDLLQQSDTDQARVRQAGFERLAALESTVRALAAQTGRMENFIYGTMATLFANVLALLKALGDIRTLRKGER